MGFPKTSIVGLHLTKPQIQHLATETAKLMSLLNIQLSSIKLLTCSDSHLDQTLPSIRDRQTSIQIRLKDLVTYLRRSSDPSVVQLSDSRAAMKRKVKLCNYASMPENMGWKDAAKRYWPMIADSCTLLLEQIDCINMDMQLALMFEHLWTERNAPHAPWLWHADKWQADKKGAKRRTAVAFDKKVKARWAGQDERAVERDGMVKLTNDGWSANRRARKYKKRMERIGSSSRLPRSS